MTSRYQTTFTISESVTRWMS